MYVTHMTRHCFRSQRLMVAYTFCHEQSWVPQMSAPSANVRR